MIKNKKKSVWADLLGTAARRAGAGHLVLLDPDEEKPEVLAHRARMCERAGVDGLLVGGSFMKQRRFHEGTRAIFESVRIPVILFPGSAEQVTPAADAILFLSLISGRNPDFLIGQQVHGAPLVKKARIEVIPTGYILVESGGVTSVQRASRTQPLPRAQSTLAADHALAAECLGMKAIYLEAGSGARKSVPEAMIRKVARQTSIPIIVGGGIRTPREAAAKARAGATFIVTGTVFEQNHDPQLLEHINKSTHTGKE